MEKKYSALLVEDNPICQRFQQTILNNHGFFVDIAPTAKEAVAKLNQMEEKFNRITYDIIFVDFMLPDINGDHLVQVIRLTTHAGNSANQNLPIIAITAYANPKTKEKLYKSGVNHIIEKPITKNNLMDVILTLKRLGIAKENS
jgi:CheY-like chemotaxis protein